MADLSPSNGARPAPCAVFAGDFNTGKSTLINALMRCKTAPERREETCAPPTFVAGAHAGVAPGFAGLSRDGQGLRELGAGLFHGARIDDEDAEGFLALAARAPGAPFRRLILVDTPGASSDALEALEIGPMPDPARALMVVVTDIEYWSARHTMEAIADRREAFGENLIVVANKADCLNAAEIRRVADKAPRRMADFGINPAPPFYALSARLEAARRDPRDEYRRRVKREVRDRCDAAFDALRVALYEFEMEAAPAPPAPPAWDALLGGALAAAFIPAREGSQDEIQGA